MKRSVIFFVLSVVVAWALSAVTNIVVPDMILSTLYTVAGIIFSVGMSIAISPKTEGVTNQAMRKAIRESFLTVRNSFICWFGFDTIAFILANVCIVPPYPEAFHILCAVFILVSIVYYTINFIQLQRLGEQIEDQILKERTEGK